MRLTRMPCAPTSQASVRTSPTSASLLVVYGVRPCSGRFPLTEPMTTIEPPRRSIIAGSSARQHRKVPVTLTRSTSCQSAGAISHSGAVGPAMPLLHTSTSTLPSSPSTRSAIASTCPTSLTSARTAIPPTSSRVSSSAATSRPTAATVAPASASASAMWRPIPFPAPVTTATAPPSASVIEHGHRAHRRAVAVPDPQRKAEEREPPADDLAQVREVLVVGDAVLAAEQVHRVDAIGRVVRAGRVDAEDLDLPLAQPIGGRGVEPGILRHVLARAAVALRGAGAQQQHVALAQLRAGLRESAVQPRGVAVLARRHVRDVQARARAPE